MADTAFDAVHAAYRLLVPAIGRAGLRWVQAHADHLALGYDPLCRSRRRLPRRLRLKGLSVALEWHPAAAPVQAQAWPRVEFDPPGAAGFGTLGAVLRSREAPQTLLGLTAGHVLNMGSFGDEVGIATSRASSPLQSLLLRGQLYDWLPDQSPGQTVALDAALFTLPDDALQVLSDDADWPMGVNRDAPIGMALALLTRQHRIAGQLVAPLTAQVSTGVQTYVINNALCYTLNGDCLAGDSGAPLWDDAERLVGIHLGAAPAGAAGQGVGTPIARVLDWAEADVVLRAAAQSSTSAAAPAATVAAPLPKQGDVETLARTLWGEARGEGPAGMAAVAHVVMNRAADRRWRGCGSLSAICLQPAQFSCWNPGDPNRAALLKLTAADPQFAQALALVATVQQEREAASLLVPPKRVDPTDGATHYHAVGVMPAWALAGERSAEIGKHIFYRHVP